MLACAATAAGKTEAVLAPLVWRLRCQPAGNGRGPRLLAIAPTRALVADLTARLETPLAQLGWRCAAQTSDFSGAASEPDVLVTTPESFDSMLVRRLRVESGEPIGHLLANVAAVFVDEAHCFDSTARGDQLVFLLARLRKLRESALAKAWTDSAEVQVCAASATVHEPHDLARKLLGADAEAILCPGSRPMDVLTKQGNWRRLDGSVAAADLAATLPVETSHERIGALLWAALESGECRKALVFVPSRRQCDQMGLLLRRYLQERRHIWVETHHGSLSRAHRQHAEDGFHDQRDAVLVATNTLEVGVDIGDVDVVALVGAPPDTSSLLQRIGRGGRRSGLTRLLPVARNAVDAAALASQLVSAVAGKLEARHRFRRWDVFPQQVISYIRQNRGQGRSMESLKTLAASAWPAPDTAEVAASLIRSWSNDGLLSEQRGKFHLAGAWEDFSAQAEGDYVIHSNISSTPAGREVRNELTGEVVGHVGDAAPETSTLTIAGRQHRILRQEECIVVAPISDEQADAREDTPNYGGRRRYVSQTFAAHVRRGCGLREQDAPLLELGDQVLWFHFGGEVSEKLLLSLFPQFVCRAAIAGIATIVVPSIEAECIKRLDVARLKHLMNEAGTRLLTIDDPGRFSDHVSEAGFSSMLNECAIVTNFKEWMATRFIWRPSERTHRQTLQALLRCG
ncbi:MAG TPA: helicase-related protein [Lacipirellulaceae bacterium]|nr:helicase-related protein [Lacipirellulaceae bacterium]